MPVGTAWVWGCKRPEFLGRLAVGEGREYTINGRVGWFFVKGERGVLPFRLFVCRCSVISSPWFVDGLSHGLFVPVNIGAVKKTTAPS